MKMFKFSIFIFLLVLMHSFSDAYKFLVIFAFPGRSHGILGEGYVKTLLNAGHEVTYITAVPIKNGPPGLRQIDMSSNFDLMPLDKYLTIKSIMNNEMSVTDGFKHFSMIVDMMNATIHNKEIQTLMMNHKEQFDAVIVEWMYSELYSGFSAVFGCPLIWSSSMEPHSMVLSLIDENLNPAYIPDHMSDAHLPLDFFGRVRELLMISFIKCIRMSLQLLESQIFTQGFGPATARRGLQLPSYDEVKYNASLMLGNSHVSTGYAVRLPQNYKPIGGYHIDRQTKPLPRDWQKLMDESTHGVIYFSMGTMLKSKQLPQEIKTGILNVFRGLRQTVIWKFEEALQDAPENVHIMDWAPQQSILAHPNCILFITHGGLLSTTEALHFGLPIIGIPMFADQQGNVNRAKEKGYGKRVDISYTMADKLKTAIEDILQNPSFSKNAKELSFIYHHRPVSPGAVLVHWVEHVVQTNGAPHLRSPALHVPFYQKMYLDFTAVILLVLTFVLYIFKFLFVSKKKSNLKKKNK